MQAFILSLTGSKFVMTLVIAVFFTSLAFGSRAQAQHDNRAQAQAGHQHGVHRRAAGLALGAAFSPSGELWIAALDEKARLFVQTSGDLGRSWGARKLLDTAGDRVVADGENRPKVAFGPNGWVVVSYTRALGQAFTGDVRMLRSGNGGKNFSPAFTVHDDRQKISHRFESTAFDSKGDLYVVWLDERDVAHAHAPAKTGGKHGAHNGSSVFGKVSVDGGKTFGPDLRLAGASCECCRIALVEAPQAGMVAMWRQVFPKNIRDHAIAPLSDLGRDKSPTRATEDQWEIAACPHHGPGLAKGVGGGFHSVWFGQRGSKPAVHYGRLDGVGRPVGTVRELPDERAEHADIAANGNDVAVVWRSFDGERTHLRAWLSKDGGGYFEVRELASSDWDNDHPRLVTRNGETWVVWRTEREIHVFKLAA